MTRSGMIALRTVGGARPSATNRSQSLCTSARLTVVSLIAPRSGRGWWSRMDRWARTTRGLALEPALALRDGNDEAPPAPHDPKLLADVAVEGVARDAPRGGGLVERQAEARWAARNTEPSGGLGGHAYRTPASATGSRRSTPRW